MQIFCCNENFCFQHIRDEIMKNFVCPNCNFEASMKNLVANKKLRENIEWYKKVMLSDNLPINNPPELVKQQVINTLTISNINGNNNIDQIPLNQNIVSTNAFENEKNVAVVNNELKINQLDKSKEDMNAEEKVQFYDSLNNKSEIKKKSEEKSVSNLEPNQPTIDQAKDPKSLDCKTNKN